MDLNAFLSDFVNGRTDTPEDLTSSGPTTVPTTPSPTTGSPTTVPTVPIQEPNVFTQEYWNQFWQEHRDAGSVSNLLVSHT